MKKKHSKQYEEKTAWNENDLDAYDYDEDLDRSLLEDILDFLKVFIAMSLVIVILAFFVIKPAVVSGRSMEPTFENGQKGFSSILSLLIEGVQRGDVVLAKTVNDDGEEVEIIKRVIALPGETIECKNSQIYINGEVLDESGWMDEDFIAESIEKYGYFNEDFNEVTLGENEYFLMGDNRPVSLDSRDLGAFTAKQIISKDFLTLFPVDRIGYYHG